MLEVRGITLEASGRRIIDIPHISLREGEFVSIIGRNGAGKSSLLKALGLPGEIKYGSYVLEGKARQFPEDRLSVIRMYSHVFQSPLLLSGSVLYNVSLPLRLRGVDRANAEKNALKWLQVVQAEAFIGRNPRTLSGGEAARVSLARALVIEPKIMFLDEPFSALDVESRAYVLRNLRGWLDLSGTTGVMVTHTYAEVAMLADRVVVMDKGQIVADGRPEEVLANPEMPFLQDFVGLGKVIPRWST